MKRLVEFYTNEGNQLAQAKALMRLPALAKASRAEAILKDPLLKASTDQLLVARPMPMATEMRAVWDAMRPLLAKAVSEQMGVEEAARRMQEDAEAKIREMNE